MSRDDAYFADILDACRSIQRFTECMSFSDYVEDYEKQLVCERLFEIIGEAAKRISPEVKDSEASLPWKKMIGMRNVVIHQYDQIDLELVWKIIQQDVPDVALKVERLLETRR